MPVNESLTYHIEHDEGHGRFGRLSCAWAVLRGRSVIYGLDIDGGRIDVKHPPLSVGGDSWVQNGRLIMRMQGATRRARREMERWAEARRPRP